jgi:small subunit ribosomal protein S29e/phospholipase B1
VRKLAPGNIGAVMALGDSITAGFAAKDLPVEYRGSVYSTGLGPNTTHSLASYLIKYNPDLTGWSENVTAPLTPFGEGLNFAVSEAKIADVPGQIARMKKKMDIAYPQVKDQWKLLTLFIGANDACDCDSSDHTPDKFEGRLRDALSYVQGNFSKTFVNVMTLFNISAVWRASFTSVKCRVEVPALQECHCLTKDHESPPNQNNTWRDLMDQRSVEFNARTNKVAAEFRALNDPEFTVSVQPGVQDCQFDLWKTPERYLSDVDCFHPSLCSHQAFSLAVWNNMFAAAGRKKTSIAPPHWEEFYCPTAEDFIQ